jgi:hypothetical protein
MPPLSMLEQNSHISLDDYLEANKTVSGNLSLNLDGYDTYGTLSEFRGNISLIKASARIISIEPAVDGRLISEQENEIFIAYGTQALGLPEVHQSNLNFGICTLDFFEENNIAPDGVGAVSICDYEYAWPLNSGNHHMNGDQCAEYMISNNSTLSGNITYIFRNQSFTRQITGTSMVLPDELQKLLKKSSGLETLEVELDALINFTYVVNDRHKSPCVDRIKHFSSQIILNDNKSFIAEGENTFFFLEKPVLREQWFRNNHFDVLVLSQKRLSAAEVFLNDELLMSVDLQDFNLTQDFFGLIHIISIDGSEFIIEVNSTPTPIQKDNLTFAYAYRFNSTYTGIGENKLTLRVNDLTNKSTEYSEILLSRALSHSENISEIETSDDSLIRPSAPSNQDNLKNVAITFGTLGILVLILLIKRIIK